MKKNLDSLSALFLFIGLLISSDIFASNCSTNNLSEQAHKNQKDFQSHCDNLPNGKEKSRSEKIVDFVTERQKINQQIFSLELEVGLLRTKRGGMAEMEYQTKMRELTDKLLELKSAPYIN